MEFLKNKLPFYGALAVDFYVLPLLMKDTGSAMLLLLFVMPLICLVTAVLYGLKNGFRIWFGLLTALLFVPSIFIFYNETAWVYMLVFGALAVLGNAVGLLFHRKK